MLGLVNVFNVQATPYEADEGLSIAHEQTLSSEDELDEQLSTTDETALVPEGEIDTINLTKLGEEGIAELAALSGHIRMGEWQWSRGNNGTV
jgi:hypothetical protein